MNYSKQIWIALFGAAGGTLIAMLWLSTALSFSKPMRLTPLIAASLSAVAAAGAATRGIKPAYKRAVDEAADLACFEADRENALEAIQEEDDINRELDRYERQVEIETLAMERTLPMQLKLQQMQQILYPVMPMQMPGNPLPDGLSNPVYPPTMGAPGALLQPNFAADTPIATFDFKRLVNIDEFPVIAIIGGMGAGKSKTLKWLAKSIFQSREIRACDCYGRKSEWQGARIYPEPNDIYALMVNDLAAIEQEKAQYRDGKSDFPERLTVIEESPDTLSELRNYQRQFNQSKSKNDRRDIVGDWLMKHLTLTRKLRRRAAFVSVSMSATEFIPPEHRDKAVTLFPATAIDEVMADIHYYKLGTTRNQKLCDQLRSTIAQTQNPCLIAIKGRWEVGSLPDLNLEGNPKNANQPMSNVDRLNNLLNQDFPEGERDR